MPVSACMPAEPADNVRRVSGGVADRMHVGDHFGAGIAERAPGVPRFLAESEDIRGCGPRASVPGRKWSARPDRACRPSARPANGRRARAARWCAGRRPAPGRIADRGCDAVRCRRPSHGYSVGWKHNPARGCDDIAGRRRELPHQLADFAPGVTDMIIDMRGDAFGVTGLDRRQQRLVRPRDLMRIVVQAGRSGRSPCAAPPRDHRTAAAGAGYRRFQRSAGESDSPLPPAARDRRDRRSCAERRFAAAARRATAGVRFRAASTPACRSMQMRKS